MKLIYLEPRTILYFNVYEITSLIKSRVSMKFMRAFEYNINCLSTTGADQTNERIKNRRQLRTSFQSHALKSHGLCSNSSKYSFSLKVVESLSTCAMYTIKFNKRKRTRQTCTSYIFQPQNTHVHSA